MDAPLWRFVWHYKTARPQPLTHSHSKHTHDRLLYINNVHWVMFCVFYNYEYTKWLLLFSNKLVVSFKLLKWFIRKNWRFENASWSTLIACLFVCVYVFDSIWFDGSIAHINIVFWFWRNRSRWTLRARKYPFVLQFNIYHWELFRP